MPLVSQRHLLGFLIAYLPGLSPVENKELCARFDGDRLSSDDGVLLLREQSSRFIPSNSVSMVMSPKLRRRWEGFPP